MFQGLLNIEGIWVQHRVSPGQFNLSPWNFHGMLLIYKTFIWNNNKKDSTWPLAVIWEAILKIWKMPINNYFMQKIDKASIYIKYQTSGFILICCFFRNKSKYIAVEWPNASCMSPHRTCFQYFWFLRNLMTLQIFLYRKLRRPSYTI